MGSGIAQLACLAGFRTVLHDPQSEALDGGERLLRENLERGAARGRWSAGAAAEATARLETSAGLGGLAACELVIEAAPERLELKRELFAGLERICAPEAVLATNTSSLSVGEIATGADRPQRICGMHFFNPPALMKLVEVVAAERSGETALATVTDVAERMGRVPVRCTDSPGFIVNRCNRQFSLEALRMLGEGVAEVTEIDWIMREDGGYPMGPFELIDLIGVDVNLEVARSFFEQRPLARWRPHPLQLRLVEEGRLGRKSGRGFYEYGEDGRRLDQAASEPDPATRRLVLERIAAGLVNEACFAAEERVAEPAEIDTAMTLGLNHPRGPFEWGRKLGAQRLLALLDRLAGTLGDDAHAAAPLLRRWAAGDPPAPG
jgi:3-hydroxybutyryl-CoA dehydrogenase